MVDNNPPYNKPPIIIPIKSELYTSFVISASIMAAKGGIRAQKVAYSSGTYSVIVFI